MFSLIKCCLWLRGKYRLWRNKCPECNSKEYHECDVCEGYKKFWLSPVPDKYLKLAWWNRYTRKYK